MKTGNGKRIYITLDLWLHWVIYRHIMETNDVTPAGWNRNQSRTWMKWKRTGTPTGKPIKKCQLRSSKGNNEHKAKGDKEEIKSGQEEIRPLVNAWIVHMKVDCPEMEAYTEKIQLDPRLMHSIVEHQKSPRNKPQWCQLEDWRSSIGTRIWPWGAVRSRREGARQLVNPRRDCPLLAGRWPTVQEAWCRENVVRKEWTRNQAEQGTPKGWEETVERPRIQQWHKEPRPETAAIRQNENKESRHKAATAS